MTKETKIDALTTPSEMDLMMYLDGELSTKESEGVRKYLDRNQAAQKKVRALEQVSSFVQTSIELEADGMESMLAGLWGGIQKEISLEAPKKSVDSRIHRIPSSAKAMELAEEKATQELVQKTHWFYRWQGHVVTGAFAAAAVALFMMLRADTPETFSSPVYRLSAPIQATSVRLESEEPVVEKLEVYDGSGVIMTIPGDSDTNENSATVVWISNDTDIMKEPI